MMHLGDFPASHTAVCIPFDSFAASTGASSAASNFVAGDVLIYKDFGTTQRSSANGITVSTSFDSQTGLQAIVIDLSDNTDAGFYAAGHEYQVGVADITIDAQTVRFWAATFSIERAGGVLALIKANTVKVDVNTIKTQAVTCAAGVTVLASVGTAAASTAQTGDTYARIGAPAGVSVSADIAAAKVDTAAASAAVTSGTFGNSALKTLIDAVDNFVDTEVADILVDTSTTLNDYVDDLETRLTAALATALQAHALGIGRVVVDAGSSTTTVVFLTINGAAASAVDDFYNGRVLIFTSGALTLQATSISDYVGATKTATVVAMTGTPASSVTAILT